MKNKGGGLKEGKRGETKRDEVYQMCGDREETRSNILHMEDYNSSWIMEANGSFQYPSIRSYTS